MNLQSKGKEHILGIGMKRLSNPVKGINNIAVTT